MRIVRLGSILNDEIEYEMWLEQPFSQPSLKLERTPRTGGDPLVTAASREALSMTIYVRIFGGDDEELSSALREEALMDWDTDRAAIELVVSDDDGGNERYREVVISSIDEVGSEQGPGQLFILSAVTHGETRWRSTTRQVVVWDAEADGETLAVENVGSLPAQPTYTFKPTAAKDNATNDFRYRSFCAVTWDGRSISHYPVDVTDGAWDTASLVSGGFIYAPNAEENIGLLVDGDLVRRWVANYNLGNTSVWANLSWQSYSYSFLRTSIGEGDTVSRIEAGSDISTYPRQGILMIGSEIFTYTDRDDSNRYFLGVTRAAKDSTAEAHTGAPHTGDRIHWLQHDIWLVYGGSGYWSNSYADFSGVDRRELIGNLEDVYKPMINLTESSNYQWIFDEFSEAVAQDEDGNVYLANRSAAWKPFGEGTSASGTPYNTLTVTNWGSGSSSGWRLPIAHYVEFLYFAGEATNLSPGQLWEVGLYYTDVYGNPHPHLLIPDPLGSTEPVSFSLTSTDDMWGREWLHFEQRSVGTAMTASMTNLIVSFMDVPVVTVMPQATMYDMQLTLTNVTTGQSLRLGLSMTLNEQIQINTYDHTVTLLDDGSSQYRAVTKSTRRRDMLALVPGTNTLQINEEGLQGMTITISFETRQYT